MPFENVVLAKVREGNPQLTVVDVAEGVEKRMMDGHGEEGVELAGTARRAHERRPLWRARPARLALAAAVENPGEERGRRAFRGRSRPRGGISAESGGAARRGSTPLHRRIGRMLAPYRGRSFLVFHPGFGYFADAYGLKEEAVEAGGRPPAPKQLRALIEKAKAEGIKTVFVQPEFDPHAPEVVAEEIGGKVVPMNGLAKDVLRRLGGHRGEDQEVV